MRLAHPHLLWLLMLVPIAVLAYGIAFAARRRALRQLGNPVLIARMSAATSVPRKVTRAALLCLCLGLLGLALARPQAGGRARLEKQRGLDLIVALDFSKSMLAKDIYPSRLERAKRELERLMDRLSGDRVGLVAFAGETLTYPPTTDYDAVKLFWRDLSPSDMPVGGTAIGRALMSGIDMLSRLRQDGGATRDQVILLLTDGEDTESEPLEAADQAAKLAIKIFAVGIGSRSGELVPELGENEQAAGYIKDKDGKYVTSRLDEDLLSKIAAKTGGGYLRADAQHFGVEAIEAALAGLKRTESDTRLVKQYDEVFEYLLLPALLLLLIEACMGERRRERKRAGKQASKIDGAQAAVVLMVLLPFVPFLGAWNPIERNNRAVESGNANMKNGKAEDALADYDKAVAELPSDPGAHFNRGNALFALSRFEEASAEFLRATQATLPSLKASAFYNLANSYFKNDKYSEAIAAYRHALGLDPSNGRAKWNLELALQKKKEEDKKKEDDKNKQDQNKDDKKDQDKKDDKKDQDKKDQDKKDQQKKKDDKKDQDKDKQDQQDKKDQQQQQEKKDQGAPPAKDDKAPDMREIDAVLDNLEHSPKDLEKMRARMRAVRRAPPAKDW